jgi:hypothetical protein
MDGIKAAYSVGILQLKERSYALPTPIFWHPISSPCFLAHPYRSPSSFSLPFPWILLASTQKVALGNPDQLETFNFLFLALPLGPVRLFPSMLPFGFGAMVF